MSTGRALGPAALLAAAAAGLSWASVFAAGPLVLPVLVPVLVMVVVDQLLATRQAVRAVAMLLVGAAAVIGVLVLGGATLAEIGDGVLTGWRQTLESTLPAQVDARLVAFVPVLTVLAGVLGTEWARRGAGPGPALAPSFVVLLLAQLFHAATGWTATAIAVGYGLAVAAVLIASRRSPARRRSVRRALELAPLLGVLVIVGSLLAWGASALALPGDRTFSVQAVHRPDLQTLSTADPLSALADDLLSGDTPAFSVTADHPVDRWPLTVLDRFDGVTWSGDGNFLALGAELPAPALAVSTSTATAEVSGVQLDGPWLPSHGRLRSASGVRPLVDPTTGVLLRGTDVVDRYTLRWDDAQVDAQALTAAAIDPTPVGAVSLDTVPAGFADLARQAVGQGVGPSVQAALVLEKWMRENYQVATGPDLPTGHSSAQLLSFLTTSKRGTSEQFATSYAILARSIGVPSRVVVGYRDDGSGLVHRGDALAWPEIAVSGIGWVPLDPTGGARSDGGGGSDLSAATEAAREDLPTPEQLAAAEGTPTPSPLTVGPTPFPWWITGLVLGLVLLALVTIPAVKVVRRFRRRRPPPRAAVIGAWLELRDTLRDHGVPVAPGSTVRELVGVAPIDPADLQELAACVDAALWTGWDTDPQLVGRAWAAAGRSRRALRRLPLRRRVRATFAVGSLRRDRRE